MADLPVHAASTDCSVKPGQHWLTQLALAFLGIGLVWRLTRYFLQFPIWGDEASLAVNFLDRDFLGLTGELDHAQVAPILFLWLQLAARCLLGTSELAMRLLPLLAGVGGLFLFWRLSRRTLPPLAAALAVGMLAVAYYPVRHSCEIKPYSFDLFAAVLLLLLAACWLQEPGRPRWLAWLTLLAPLAVAASYPAIFIMAAVSLTLIVYVWRQRDWRCWAWFIACNLLVLAAFAASFLIVGRAQVATRGDVQDFYLNYWEEGFPPPGLMAKLHWLAAAHTGEMLAYPIGGQSGASLATLILVVMGIGALARRRQWWLLSLCTLPFVLGMLAALLHRYPYGASARLAQHLAPCVCLLAGLGLARSIEAVAGSPVWQRRYALGAAAVLALFAGVCLVRDIVRPTKTEAERWSKQMVNDIFARAGDDPILVISQPEHVDSVFEWYLKVRGDQVSWGTFQPDRMEQPPARIWCLRLDKIDGFIPRLEARLRRTTPAWRLTYHDLHVHQPDRPDIPAIYCRVLGWEAAEPDAHTTAADDF